MTGEPVFIELGVPDADTARTFWGGLLGWQPSGASGNGHISTGGLDVGLHSGDEDRHFEVFFTVDDLDAAMAKVTELGGRLVSEVHADNADFGSWVECADDQGVRFGLVRR